MNNNDSIILAVFGGICFVLLAVVVAFIFYLASIATCFRRMARRNRKMDPAHVWLNLIPLFSTVWMPVTLDRLTDSLRAEYEDRGYEVPDDSFGRGYWIAYLTLFACAMIPYLGVFPGFVGLIVWIVYWSKLAGYSRQLAAPARETDDDRDDPEYAPDDD